MTLYHTIIMRLKSSRLFKDSFWAVFGNGIGYALLLLSGIIIARFLGKDVYGEYGIVKTTMLYIASFAALGLGFTSTKYIAQYLIEDTNIIRTIINSANKITFIFCIIMAFSLFIASDYLAIYLEEPDLNIAFRILSVIVISKAMATTGLGILAGFGAFKKIGIGNIISGITMLVLCVPLTHTFGLMGALSSLLISQIVLAVYVQYHVYKLKKEFPLQESKYMTGELVRFSLPVALQESLYTICNWGAILLLTKLSTLGEVGIYSASTQWNAIVFFIPGLLSNVVLSHLSGTNKNTELHVKTVKLMFGVNFICTIIPFLFICLFFQYIVSFYGETFQGMQSVLIISVLSAVMLGLANVFHSEIISVGRTWLLFSIRLTRDILILIAVYAVLTLTNGINGAKNFAIIYLLAGLVYLFVLAIISRNIIKAKRESVEK